MPVYEIRGCPDPLNPGKTVNYYTSDPGKGLITGAVLRCESRKGTDPSWAGARAPYFHNGAAANLDEW